MYNLYHPYELIWGVHYFHGNQCLHISATGTSTISDTKHVLQYSYPYINTPIFTYNSQYDTWQLENTLQLNCLPPRCSNEQLKLLENQVSTVLLYPVRSTVCHIFMTLFILMLTMYTCSLRLSSEGILLLLLCMILLVH